MSYERHDWVDAETITAAKLNNIEDGVEEAAQSGGGGYDLVIQINTPIPNSMSNCVVKSGGTAAALYDKAVNGEPVLALVIGFSSSDVYTSSAMYSCVVSTGSYENEIMIFDTYNTWNNAYLIYNGNGVSVAFQ